MEKEEKSDDEEKGILRRGAAEKEEFFGLKFKSGISVSKERVHYCTTPVPTWKIHQLNNGKQNFAITCLPPPPLTISARKLGAQLWESIQIILPLSTEMRKGTSSSGVKLRQLAEKGCNDHPPPIHLSDPSPQQLDSAGSLRRQIEASLMKHHHSIERNSHALQPVSPASYSSSTEVTAYFPPVTPTGSSNIRRSHREATCNLKTSTELLQVLNRIWSLEEQHTSNISLIKALKIELNHTRSRIKDLLQEQQTDRQEIGELMKQVAEEDHTRKSKEQARVKAAVQSVKDELEDERKLRRRSETLHRKLSRELSEVKYTFAKALKELESERKARMLLEDLCDEFAKGIGEYEHEVRATNHKSERDNCCRDDHDRLILHISEAWLDERMQMNLAESRFNPTEKNTVVEKLSTEIETFLQAKRSGSSNSKSSDILHPKDLPNDVSLRRQSLKSVHLNDTVTAPQAAQDKGESHCSDSHFIEPNKNESEKGSNIANGKESVEIHPAETARANSTKKRLGSRERTNSRTLSNIQFEEQMASVREKQELVREQESDIPHELENFLTSKEGILERNVKRDGTHGSKSKNMNNNLVTSQSMLLDCEKLYPEKNYKEDLLGHSAWRRNVSPERQWSSKFTSPDIEISASSSKWPPRGVQETTLKAKLLEARQEGRRSRVTPSKGTS
ncbi:uncharacterized protein At5g41620-like [Papaver somniferum]|uniref:uncharacterized protein At5g41620-like n=1 Tax=Papaver somniferum TaxID=3469 RepID=UPI000E6F9E8C|nr:uncharacterized protein At5g41620-like [Papaver somniferum]